MPVLYRMYNGKPKVYGAVLLAMSDDPCWNAYIVTHSAGLPGTGLGGCAYEAALYAFPLVAPDRGSISDLAQRVWERYNKRTDVIKRPFDDIENPKTSTPEDDCYLHNVEALDQAYKLTKRPAGYDEMRKKHLEYGVSPKILEQMGAKLFENGY